MEGPPSMTTPIEGGDDKLEARESVLERAQEARFALFSNILERRVEDAKRLLPIASMLASKAVDLSPVGTIKMTAELMRGKTAEGTELSRSDRMMYALINAIASIAHIGLAYAASTGSATALSISAGGNTLSYALYGIQNLRTLGLPESLTRFTDAAKEALERYGTQRAERLMSVMEPSALHAL